MCVTLMSQIARGAKNADDEMLRTYSGEYGGNNITINEEQHENRVSKDLLAGKETQQVRELRYRTYLVDREAKKYVYFSPYMSKRRGNTEKKMPKILERDGYSVVTIQENNAIVENVSDGLKQVGGRGERTRHWIDIQRDGNFTPRYRLEDFVKKIVVMRKDNDDIGTALYVDMYVSKYPDEYVYVSKGFVNEIKKAATETDRYNDIFDISGISFITSNAWGVDDLIVFRLRNPMLMSIDEYDGNYVIRMRAGVIVDAKDMMDEFYEKSVTDKYKNKEKREHIVDITGNEPVKEYVCEECGKVVRYNTAEIDAAEVGETEGLAEYYDMQISKETYGHVLCNKCMMNKLNEWLQEWQKIRNTHS